MAVWASLRALGLVAAEFAVAQQAPPDLLKFLPPPAVLKQQMSVDFENDGLPEKVLVYDMPDESTAVYRTTVVRVLRHRPPSGWTLAFEDGDPKLGSQDEVTVEKLRSPSGKEGVLVITLYSGAGTATMWRVLAWVKDKVTKLDPAPGQ